MQRRPRAADPRLQPGARPGDRAAWCAPGDAVLVDDPGYPNLMFMLRFLGARLIGVPRTPQGYDLAALEAADRRSTSRACSSRSRGCRARPIRSRRCAQLHRVLQLAEAHDVTLVENDIYVDLDPEARPVARQPRPAARACVYVGSYSKTISPNMRVGYVAGPCRRCSTTSTQLKMVSGLTSSDLHRAPDLRRVDRRALAQAPEEPARPPRRRARARRRSGWRRSASSCSTSPRPACTCGRAIRDLTDSAVLSQPAALARHHARARASVSRRAAADATGCASTSRSATSRDSTTSSPGRSTNRRGAAPPAACFPHDSASAFAIT